MRKQDNSKTYHGTIYAVAGAALIGGVYFYSGVPWEKWSVMLTLTLLMTYLQTFSVRLGERMSYSLSTATVFPIIYLCGTTPAMIISGFTGVVDGIIHKKDRRRVIFNTAQFALSGLIGSVTFNHMLKVVKPHGFGGVLAMSLGMLAYIVTNIALVCLVVAVWKGISVWEQLKLVRVGSLYSSMSSGFIGLIFTFFVISYGFWGLAAFSALLINLSGLLKTAAEVSGERARRKELEEELLVDEMTQAYNFRFLNKWLGDPKEEHAAILFMDIDDFAVFNNNYGHAEGDKVLKLLVETINKSVRSGDKVVRYGGDEFVVILNGMDRAGAKGVAQRIVNNLKRIGSPGREHPITVSVGIAVKPQHTKDKHQLLLLADQAMYEAKNAGKNTTRIWKSEKDPA